MREVISFCKVGRAYTALLKHFAGYNNAFNGSCARMIICLTSRLHDQSSVATLFK